MPATISDTITPGFESTNLRTSGTWPAQWSGFTRHYLGPDDWFVEAIHDIRRLTELEEDWDGYGSSPIGASVFETTVFLLGRFASEADPLPVPDLAPVTGGGLHLEFGIGSKELEIEVLPDTSIEVLLTDGDVEQESPRMRADWLNVKCLLWVISGHSVA